MCIYIYIYIYICIGVECMDSLQKAVIHAPEPCEARFILDAHTLFDVVWTVELRRGRTID